MFGVCVPGPATLPRCHWLSSQFRAFFRCPSCCTHNAFARVACVLSASASELSIQKSATDVATGSPGHQGPPRTRTACDDVAIVRAVTVAPCTHNAGVFFFTILVVGIRVCAV